MQDELHHLRGTFIHYCFIKSYTRLAAITVAQKQWRCRNQDGILPPHLAAGEKCSQNETHSTYTLIPWQSRHVNEKHNYKVQLAEDGEKLPLFTFIAVNPKKIERISNSSLCTVLFSDLSQCFGNCEKPPVGIVGCYVTSAIFYCLTSFGFFCVVFFFFNMPGKENLVNERERPSVLYLIGRRCPRLSRSQSTEGGQTNGQCC